MKRRNGFTLVEVIVSIVLVSIILVSMLTTLVKLKELYNEIHENSDALVYSSSIARIINNDVMENNGIRYATCNSEGDLCEIILGNDNKRRIEIDTKTSVDTKPDGRGTLRSLNSVSTLRYIDTTNVGDEPIVYLRTLEANIYTSYDANGVMKYTTSDGFNFNRMVLDQYERDTVDGKKDVVTSIKINIYDGIDETDQNYASMVYAAGRYDDSGYRGREFRIELDDNGSNTYRGTDAVDEVFGVGYFAADSAHNLDEKIYSINVPKKDGWMFAGYYHNTGSINPVAIVDSEGNIVASSTHFVNDEIITNGVGRVQAVWELCVGGYEYNRDTGECKQRTYTVALDKAGGTGGPNSITAKYRVILPTIEVPTRAGYIFNGYFTGTNGSGKKYIETNGTSNGIWLEADWTSDKKLHASWTARNDTPYKVVHWLQNVDAADAENSTNYTATDTENKQGVTDSTVTPPVKSYVGFTSPAAKQLVIKGDGSAVLNYYYKRNKYTVTVNAGSGISSVSGGGTYHYGKNITINATPKAGYSWSKWTNASGGQVTNNKSYSFNVTGSVNYTANATASSNTPYTVRHYKQKLDAPDTENTTNYELANTDNLTGTTDASVTPGRKTYTGFTAPAGKTVTIKGDGSTTVDYYYKRVSYTVTLNKGAGISSVSGAGNYQYGKSVTIDATANNGNTWLNWTSGGTAVTTTKRYTFTISGNVTYTANASANKYTITLNNSGATTNGATSVAATYGASLPAFTSPSRKFTITYNANGGSVSPTSATATSTLNGWYTASSGGTKVINANGTLVANVSGYTDANAKWSRTSGVTLYSQWTNGSVTTPKPTLSGKTATGWWNNTSGGTKIVDVNKTYTPTSNVTLYAQWKTDKITYNDISTNYSCANRSVGSNYVFTYTGCCEVLSDGGDNWKVKLLGSCSSYSGSATLTFGSNMNLDVFLVGGGGSSGAIWGGGGGGGYTKTYFNINLNANTTYNTYVGAGGSGSCSTSNPHTCTRGAGPAGQTTWLVSSSTYYAAGGNGGNCGGAGSAGNGWGSGQGTCIRNTDDSVYGGTGGSRGGTGYTNYYGCMNGGGAAIGSKNGRNGQNRSTCEFASDTASTSTSCASGLQYSAGGNGGCCYDFDDWYNLICVSNARAGTKNTGNGGSGPASGSNITYAGGSGIIVFRNKR